MTAPRAVFDCVVFLQGAARETGPAGACFRLVNERAVSLYLSRPLLTYDYRARVEQQLAGCLAQAHKELNRAAKRGLRKPSSAAP